ncbi:MAG: trypsin-like peptidase domain-containing protein [Clostridia bacterium]|nr:trypsin-like peptidase domain-containing protein [Clostridia bacterium]
MGLFIYLLITAAISLLFLIFGYEIAEYSQSLIETKSNDDNEIIANATPQNSVDLSFVTECTVNISVFNDKYLSEATGVIISADGYIVTNDHIYQDISNPKIFVFDSNGKKYEAEFVAGDSKYDVSVIKIDTDNHKYLTFDDNSELKKGDELFSVGRNGSITKGIVCDFLFEASDKSKSVKMIRTDCAVNPGDSGGPVVSDGKLVAINCSKTVSIDVEGMSYLLPSDIVKRAVNQLINDKKITDRAQLGISYKYISPVYAIQNNSISGIRIEIINADSDLYGKNFDEGDVIVALDGKEITSEYIFLEWLSNHRAGDTAELTIRKINGTDRKVNITFNSDSSYSSFFDE